MESVWASRTRLLGAYAFAAGVLSKLGAAASVDCPVCFDTNDDYYVAPCGHFVCSECLPQVQDCPLCRARGPVWRSGSSLRQQLEAELAKIIHGLGETERVLVVSPLKTMLDDVRKEMSRLGVKLAILHGGAV